MVEWTDFERTTIKDIFSKVDHGSVGHQAPTRYMNAYASDLWVYPWTQRYFGKFGNLYNAAAIAGNPNVVAHGLTVVHGLEKATKNIHNIKETFADLSMLHSEKLHVDPDNFRLLADCLTIVTASTLGTSFTAEVQAVLHKFLAVVIAALRKQYH